MSASKKRKGSAYSQLKGLHRAVPILLVALALFIAICFITQNTGAVGRAISEFLLGCFSIGGYFIPALIVVHAVFYSSDITCKRVLISRIVFSLVLVITISVLAHAIVYYGEELTYSAEELYSNGVESVGGGFIGGSFAYAIILLIDYIGLIILTLTVFALYIAYFLAGENNAFRAALGKLLYKTVSFCAKIEAKFKNRKQEQKDRKEEKEKSDKKLKQSKRAAALMAKEEKLYDDEFFAVDNGLKELRINELGISEQRSDADIEKNPTLHEKVRPKSAANDEPQYKTESEPLKFKEKKRFNADYGIDDNGDIIIEQPSAEYGERKSHPSYDFSDRADAVFTTSFNPFNIEENEKLANKPSSKSVSMGFSSDTVTEVKDSESTRKVFSEKELEEARRRARFELRREQMMRDEAERKVSEEKQSASASESTASYTSQQSSYTRPDNDVYSKSESSVYSEQKNTPYSSQTSGFSQSSEKPFTSQNTESPYKSAFEYKSESVEKEAPSYQADNTAEFRTFSSPEPKVYHAAESDDTIRITRSVMNESEDEFTPVRKATFTFDEEAPADTEEKPSTVFNFDTDEDEEEEINLNDTAPEEDDADDVEIPPERQNPDILKYREMYSMFSEPKAEEHASERDDDIVIDEDYDEKPGHAESEDEDGDDIPFDDYMPVRSPVVTQAPKQTERKPDVEKPDYSTFKFPPIDLLAKNRESEDPTIHAEINENGDKLIDALAQFNVKATIRSVDRGPRITRYEIVPARGVRVNSVISLFDDIALNLAAEGIRMEAPIPGKSAIGVEIPNKHSSNVLLRDLLETEEFKNESSKTFSCIGKDVTGIPVFGDMSKMPHILVAGATGMGKSVCINSILISILYKARPDEVKFIMIDPKTVEFTMYNGIPHLLVPVVTDVKQAAGALMWAIDEMNRRYELMAKHEVRKLDSYNDIVRENPSLGEPLPKIIIVIDELNDLMQQVRKPVEGLITNITQKARAAGIHMIIGTQRPSVDVITGVIKANVPSRISCKVTSFNDSKTILDQAGAEKLLDKGDMLYAPVGKPKPVRVQGAFVSDGEVEKIMKFLKSNVKGAVYDEQAMEGINKATQKCLRGNKDSGFDDDFDTDDDAESGGGYFNDKQFLEAVDLAIKQGKISTSLLQRKIGVGYGKAAKFIDIMEEQGIVSEPNGQKPRDVLVTRDEWSEIRARRSLDD